MCTNRDSSLQDLTRMTLIIAEYCSIVINEDLEIVSFSHRRELAAAAVLIPLRLFQTLEIE